VSRVAVFFDFVKERIGSARKYAPAARGYALFRTLYHAGLRSDEASKLEIADVYFGRGPFGKLHVRFGKGARTSGPRPRWVPMLDHLDLVVRWYLEDVRPMLPDSAVLFCDQSGGAMARGTIRNRLRYLQDLEHCSPADATAHATCADGCPHLDVCVDGRHGACARTDQASTVT